MSQDGCSHEHTAYNEDHYPGDEIESKDENFEDLDDSEDEDEDNNSEVSGNYPESEGKGPGAISSDDPETENLNIDDFHFPLPPGPAILPLTISKNDIITKDPSSPDRELEKYQVSLSSLSGTLPRAKRIRKTLKTFEDLREYTQNRAQLQHEVDYSEQSRTFFRPPFTSGSEPYSPRSSGENPSSNPWGPMPKTEAQEYNHDRPRTSPFEYGSPRRARIRRVFNLHPRPKPEFINQPEAPQMNENNPSRNSWRPLSPDPSQPFSIDSNAQDFYNATSPVYTAGGQDANNGSEYELDELRSISQGTMRPTEYQELVAKGTADDCSPEPYLDPLGASPTYNRDAQPKRHEGLEQNPIRGLNFVMKDSQQSLVDNHETLRDPFDDTYQPYGSSGSTFRRPFTSSSAQPYKGPPNFSKPFSALPRTESLDPNPSSLERSSAPNSIPFTSSSDVESFHHSPSYETTKRVRRAPSRSNNAVRLRELSTFPKVPERVQELSVFPNLPEKAHISPFSNILGVNNGGSSQKTSPVPINIASSENNPGYFPSMWARAVGYTSRPDLGLSHATNGASLPLNFGSLPGETILSIPTFPSPAASSLQLSSPVERSIEHDNPSEAIIMKSTQKKSNTKGWMRWSVVRDKFSNGITYSQKRKDGLKASSNVKATAERIPSPIPRKTRKQVKDFKYMDPNVHPPSGKPANCGTLGDWGWEDLSEYIRSNEEGPTTGESSRDGARNTNEHNSNTRQPQPAELDTAKVVPSPPTRSISAFCSKGLAFLGRVWSAGIRPTFSKLRRKVVGTKSKPQTFYMRGSRERLTFAQRIRYAMSFGKGKRRTPAGGEDAGGAETAPADLSASSVRSVVTIEPLANHFNSRNSDEVETRQLADPVGEIIAARGSMGLWTSSNATKPVSTRKGLQTLVSIKSKTKYRI